VRGPERQGNGRQRELEQGSRRWAAADGHEPVTITLDAVSGFLSAHRYTKYAAWEESFRRIYGEEEADVKGVQTASNPLV
jgi:hypothetical protein